MKGLEDLMKQAQDIQQKMQDAQGEMAAIEVVGESGAGLVKVTMNGRHAVRSVVIEPSLYEEEREVLEDLIAAAVNDAVKKVEQANKEKMSSLTGGLGLPDGFRMPF